MTNQLDELSATGKFPDLPNPTDLAKTVSKELRNVFSSTPEDLESPEYTVVKTTAEYEIRDYAPFVVCSREMGSAAEAYNQRSANTFNALAGFLFGRNSEKVGRFLYAVFDVSVLFFLICMHRWSVSQCIYVWLHHVSLPFLFGVHVSIDPGNVGPFHACVFH